MGEFSQKTNEVRSEGSAACASVQQALILFEMLKTLEPQWFQGFLFPIIFQALRFVAQRTSV